MSSTTDISNNDKQAAQLFGSGAFGIPAGTNAQRPANPVAGMIRWNISTQKIEYRGTNSWQGLLGTEQAATDYVQVAAPKIGANLNAQNHRLTGVADPVDPQDAVTKASLEARLTTGNIDADTLDGYDSSHFATYQDLQDLQDNVDTGLAAHIADFNNPHHVTKAQVGLGSYPSDPLNLPISIATQAAINALSSSSAGGFVSKSGDTMAGNLDMGGFNLVNINNFVGSIWHFAMASSPAGFLVANGAAVSRTTYARLFAKIGTTHGNGNGTSTFNLPDLRGYFVRGANIGGGNGSAPSSVVGGVQADAFQEHSHPGSAVTNSGAHQHTGKTDANDPLSEHRHQVTGAGDHSPNDGRAGEIGNANDGSKFLTDNNDDNSRHRHNFTTDNGGAHTHGLTIAPQGSTETRPMNVSMLPCIMY